MIIKAVYIFILVAEGAALLSGLAVPGKHWAHSEAEIVRDVGHGIGVSLIVCGVLLTIDYLIEIYLWIVVYSFYHQLKEGHLDSAAAAYIA